MNRHERRKRARNARDHTKVVRRRRHGMGRAIARDMVGMGLLPEGTDLDEAAAQINEEMTQMSHEIALKEELPDDYAAVVFVSKLMDWTNGGEAGDGTG